MKTAPETSPAPPNAPGVIAEPGPFSAAAPTAHARATRCPNCGSDAVRAFCPDCGQENHPSAVPVKELVGDVVGEFFKFDAKLWVTLVPLLTKPGLLTADYLDGRRARYIGPLRLYFIASTAYFIAFSRRGQREMARTMIQNTRAGAMNGVARAGPISDEKRAQVEKKVAMMQTHLLTGVEWFANNLSTIHIVLMPIDALILWALYRHRRRLYAEHVVFVAYLNCFNLLVTTPVLLVAGLSGLQVVSAFTLPIYAYFAARRVFAPESAGATLGKIAVFSLGHILVPMTLGVITALIYISTFFR